jgi:hypothetical protein
MSFLTIFAILGFAIIAALVWGLSRARSRGNFDEFIRGHKTTAQISSMAELIDSGNHVEVALTLDRTQIFYENAHLQARLDIARLDEVEYDSEQGTGKNILRLRAHNQSFEFILDPAIARQWTALLPPHRMGEPVLSVV